MQRPHVHVDLTRPHADGLAPRGQPSIDEGTDVLVAAIARLPERVQLAKGASGELEGTPDPPCTRVTLFDTDLQYAPTLVREDGIEPLGRIHGEQEEGERIVAEGAQRILGEPDRVRQADDHELIR